MNTTRFLALIMAVSFGMPSLASESGPDESGVMSLGDAEVAPVEVVRATQDKCSLCSVALTKCPTCCQPRQSSQRFITAVDNKNVHVQCAKIEAPLNTQRGNVQEALMGMALFTGFVNGIFPMNTKACLGMTTAYSAGVGAALAKQGVRSLGYAIGHSVASLVMYGFGYGVGFGLRYGVKAAASLVQKKS